MKIFRMRGTDGLSLIEVVVAMLLVSIVTTSVYKFFAVEQRARDRMYGVQERDRNLRVAMNMLVRELKDAGYQAAGDGLTANLSDWIPDNFAVNVPLHVNLDANPRITLGGEGEPDMISFLSMLPANTNPTTLSVPAIGTSLTTALSESDLGAQYSPGDLVCLGDAPVYARVTTVFEETLEIDADPILPGSQPCSIPLPAGTRIGEISVVTYAVFNAVNDPQFSRHTRGRPVLKRRVNAGGFQPVAENIQDMQLGVEADGRIRVSLTGITDSTAWERVAHEAGGAVVRTCQVRLPNVTRIGIGTECRLPAAPENFKVLDALNADHPCRIVLSWNPVGVDSTGAPLDEKTCAVTGYRVFVDLAPNTYGCGTGVPIGAESGYLLDVGFMPADVYYVSVAAVNSGGVGKKTAEAIIRDQLAPAAPVGLSAVLETDESVTLSWTEPADCDLAGFHVYRSTAHAAVGVRISNGLIPSGTAGFSDKDPPSGENCLYTVCAEDHGFNVSALSEAAVIFIPGKTTPETP